MFFKSSNRYIHSQDHEIIERYKTVKDPLALAELFSRYCHLIFLNCEKYLQNEEDSRDAVMEIFIKLAEDLKNQEVNNFKAWLITITRNHCLSVLRRASDKRKSIDSLRYELNSLLPSEMEDLWNEDIEQGSKPEMDASRLIEELKAALSQLKEEQEVCIRLFYLKGKSYREIAVETGFDLKKVKSCLQNGIRNLRILLYKMVESEKSG